LVQRSISSSLNPHPAISPSPPRDGIHLAQFLRHPRFSAAASASVRFLFTVVLRSIVRAETTAVTSNSGLMRVHTSEVPSESFSLNDFLTPSHVTSLTRSSEMVRLASASHHRDGGIPPVIATGLSSVGVRGGVYARTEAVDRRARSDPAWPRLAPISEPGARRPSS
jgi:hypothetical protein